jgi:hypothetical protein
MNASPTLLERRMRWRLRLERVADIAFGAVLLATLALALAPLAVNLLRSDVRAAIEVEEEIWLAERSVGLSTAMLTGRSTAAIDAAERDALPAVDRAGTAFAGLR